MQPEHPMTATDLIADSIAYDRIARAPYTEALHAALTASADDSCDSNEGMEYWGGDAESDDDTDMEWRVTLYHA